jgi:hypothetical protein
MHPIHVALSFSLLRWSVKSRNGCRFWSFHGVNRPSIPGRYENRALLPQVRSTKSLTDPLPSIFTLEAHSWRNSKDAIDSNHWLAVGHHRQHINRFCSTWAVAAPHAGAVAPHHPLAGAVSSVVDHCLCPAHQSHRHFTHSSHPPTSSGAHLAHEEPETCWSWWLVKGPPVLIAAVRRWSRHLTWHRSGWLGLIRGYRRMDKKTHEREGSRKK